MQNPDFVLKVETKDVDGEGQRTAVSAHGELSVIGSIIVLSKVMYAMKMDVEAVMFAVIAYKYRDQIGGETEIDMSALSEYLND